MASQTSVDEIVWPPVVVVENAGLGYGADGKSIGLDNAEIRHIVEKMVQVEYRRVVALYDANGHQGRALVLFPETDVGYVSALALHDAFKERKRGREAYDQGKIVEKELYGYLADPDDMRKYDPRKRVVKRWSKEIFREKVLKPQQLRPQEFQLAKAHIAQAQENFAAVLESLDAEEKELELYRLKVAEAEQRREAEKQRAERLKQEHEQIRAECRDAFRKQRDEIKNKYKTREETIRELKKNQEENLQLQAKVQALESDIEDRNKLQEKLARLTISNSAHQMEMETRLAEIENSMQQQLEAATATRRQKRLKMQEEYGAEVERMLENQRQKKNELDKRIRDCDEELQRTDCVICTEKLVPPKLKMLYTCGHACICEECFPAVWEKDHYCRLCRNHQLSAPHAIPSVIYM